ncbi:hypothetical protein D9756_007648 [Leucocoprinus leucothites]|uniref:CoA-binding domain-containing protein n=1 Tax=Leucocoprinus leucothites TaxID=201217 RepID=A0A8H5D2C7_9AGAR|nr:hypothetical protein D9756_007648 [Leucoagaricus leucothites]
MAQLGTTTKHALRYKQTVWQSLSRSAQFFQRAPDMTTAQEIKKKFLSSPNFAVVGASKDQSKFGTKVSASLPPLHLPLTHNCVQILKWYQARNLDITPVHPKETELEGVATVSNLAGLPSPASTSVSIVTPPKVTLNILKEAKELKVPALWLQPGAEDETVADFIKENGLAGQVIYGGPCLLVEGDGIRKSLL